MHVNRISAAMAFVLTASFSAFGAGMDMSKSGASTPAAPTTAYRFELAGAPQKGAPGSSVVSVKLVHVFDNKPVSGAIVIGEKADMGPVGMAAMTAPVKAMPEKNGVYQFAIQNGSVWNKPDNWSLSIDAKVPGEPRTVHGSVVVKLSP